LTYNYERKKFLEIKDKLSQEKSSCFN